MSSFQKRLLTENDLSAWAAYARTVAPLPGRTFPDQPPPITAIDKQLEFGGATPIARSAPPVVPAPQATLSVGHQPGGLDNSTWNRLRLGKLGPSRTLDLHGRTAQRAFHALHAFVLSAYQDRVRCVEVITGRGSGEGGGVIRREFPLWLNLPALRPLILAASHPHAANPGSVRLLLRRAK